MEPDINPITASPYMVYYTDIVHISILSHVPPRNENGINQSSRWTNYQILGSSEKSKLRGLLSIVGLHISYILLT